MSAAADARVGGETLSVRAAATATGLSLKAVRRRIERGTLDSVVVDGRRRISSEELRRRGLLPERRSAAASPTPEPALPPGDVHATRALLARIERLERRVEWLELRHERGRDDDASAHRLPGRG